MQPSPLGMTNFPSEMRSKPSNNSQKEVSDYPIIKEIGLGEVERAGEVGGATVFSQHSKASTIATRSRSGSTASTSSTTSSISFWSQGSSSRTPTTPPTPSTPTPNQSSYFPIKSELIPIEEGVPLTPTPDQASNFWSSTSKQENKPSTPTFKSECTSTSTSTPRLGPSVSPIITRPRSNSQNSHKSVVSFDMVGGGSLSFTSETEVISETEVGKIMKNFKSSLLKKVRNSGGPKKVHGQEMGEVDGANSLVVVKKNKEVGLKSKISGPTLVFSTYNPNVDKAFDLSSTAEMESKPTLSHLQQSKPFELHQDNIRRPKGEGLVGKGDLIWVRTGMEIGIKAKGTSAKRESSSKQPLLKEHDELSTLSSSQLLPSRRSSSFGPRTSSLTSIQTLVSKSTSTSSLNQAYDDSSKEEISEDLEIIQRRTRAQRRRAVEILSNDGNLDFSLSHPETISSLTSDGIRNTA